MFPTFFRRSSKSDRLLARAEPVAVAKHGRPVVVVLAVEEYERLKSLDAPEANRDTEERD